ncbi:MAG: DUF3179 domain-containing (seleno)protein [Bacteroidota bacterium]
MKKTLFFTFLIVSVFTTALQAQMAVLEIYLFDEAASQAIENAHVFLTNTTFGDVSDENGAIRMQIPSDMSEDLLISHVSYNLRVFTANQYFNFQKGDTIWLSPNNLNLEEIVVTEKRSNKWKKNFKQFQKAFLGQDEAANKCQILNPEVLRFEEKDGNFSATAIDLLQVRNEYLGYEVQYLLRELVIKADGSIDYLGQAKFTAIDSQEEQEQYAKNREQTYFSSPKHFFFSILNNELEANGYETEVVTYREGQFIPLIKVDASTLLKPSPNGKNSWVYFNEFLKVTHKNNASVSYSKMGMRRGGIESQRFSANTENNKANVEYPTSYLYKLTPQIEINQYGNVLNSKVVKEYGFWANQRFARQLPFDYGNDYQLERKEEAILVAQEEPILKEEEGNTSKNELELFTTLAFSKDSKVQDNLLQSIDNQWHESHTPALIEVLGWSRNAALNQKIKQLLAQKNNESPQKGYYEWIQWLWERPIAYPDYYSDLKAELYAKLDPNFYRYFNNQQATAQVRLDEIVWGGVKQDGIPPLRSPKMIAANEASYLEDQHIVFGFYINGIARAYPKRILAWHEFFTDTFDDLKIAGVYCTLCGTVIAYDMTHEGTFHDLGTSGFLYRSNKLMYDKATQSLWNTIEGKPVLGKLANQNIELKTYPLVTTTWGEWKKAHPETEVLSIETGHRRNYDEGIAYQEYFSTDRLMFPVPAIDQQLPNKTEVLIIRAPDYQNDPLAITIDFLKRKKWYSTTIDETNVLVLSDKTGTARAYDIGNTKFKSYQKGQLKDDNGVIWKITEDALLLDDQRLKRLPAHRIFWFAWYNTYSETRLVK